MTLNITNGDSATAIMRAAGIQGELLPWRDVLHEGPVPAGLSLQALSEVRAQFIHDCGWADLDDVRADFRQRDGLLAASNDYPRVRLWFEHDLYDQLQLVQILDWFYWHPPSAGTGLSLICTDRYLGTLTADEMLALQVFEAPVTQAHRALARDAWAAFRAPSPHAWQALLQRDTGLLPFLDGAVRRMLEEYPACSNGLSRTAQTALRIIAAGESRPGRVFAQYQETEERRFLGDASFWLLLNALLQSDPPLLSSDNGEQLSLRAKTLPSVFITRAGEAVLAGQRHAFDVMPPDRWIGGVHLTGENCWCRDAGSLALSRACA